MTISGVGSLNRAAILVEDVEESGRFYTDVLGMEPLYTEANTTDEILPQLVRLVGYAEGAMRFRFYRSENERTGLVALFEVSGARRHGAPASGRMMVGEACLVFYHNQFDDLLGRLEADGCTLVSPPETLMTPAGPQREMIVRNREGTLFNFIEARA